MAVANRDRLRWTAGALVGLLVLLVVPGTARAEAGGAAATAVCDRAGDGPVRGQAAVDRLGSDGLTATAARSGEAADELRDRLLDDDDLWVDRCGVAFAVESRTEVPGTEVPVTEASGTAAPSAAATFPYGQTFALHSRPGAARVLHLDFTGVTVAGSNPWAQSYTGGTGWTAGAFDTDGRPGTFSAAEQDVVQDVWRRVSEDFRPFDIDVTTEDPGTAALERTSPTDQSFGTRVVITDDTTIAARCSCQGIAYIGVFTRTGANGFSAAYNAYSPAWVFADARTQTSAQLATAASHEAGHTFGLNHDGSPSTGYYGGHGAWTPIMGNGLRPVSQWSAGEYAGATNTQDDLAVIASGAPFAADDHGATAATATVLDAAPNPEATGVIGRRDDRDLFRFTAEGPTTIEVRPAAVAPDLDVRADLLLLDGSAIASSDPAVGVAADGTATGLDATITRTLAAGDYLLQVDGVGWGDARTTGYSDYASLGAYTVAIATDAPGQAPPAAVATRFHPLVPGRVLDSRPGPTNVGAFASPWQPGPTGARDIQIGGLAGVPVDAAAVVLNVTAVNPTASTFVQLWPAGESRPTFGSSLNVGPGQIVANAVTVKLGSDGRVRVLNAVGTTDLVVDVAGYYRSAPGGAGFTALTPVRLLDSRPGPANVGPFATPWSPGAAGARDIPIGGRGGVPAGADAVVLNVTAVDPTASTFLQLWPTGAPQPVFGSSVNAGPGQVVPNQVTVALGTGGAVRLLAAAGSVDVVIDVAGYYDAGTGSDFYALAPGRVLDSRSGHTNVGAFASAWASGPSGARDVAIAGLAGVPPDAAGVVLNVTAVNPSATSYLQVWPTGAPQPALGSSLNFGPGQIVPNAVTVGVGTGGRVRVLNAVGTVDVVVDVAGYFA